MWHRFVAIIEIWIGISFFTNLVSYTPVVGVTIGGVLNAITGFISQMPFYGVIMMLLGTALLIDGIIRVRH